jgi:3-isopropylmalate/(R)-2-methylmalate dehydratase large subunit
MGKTISEKILAKASGRKSVVPGEIIYPIADVIVCPEASFPGLIDQLIEAGVKKVVNPEKIIVTVDHDPMLRTDVVATRFRKLKTYIKELGIKHFYDIGNHGISHFIPIEKGLVRPGMFVYSFDTHASISGAIGAFGAAILYDLPIVLATGSVWIKVPFTLKIILSGSLKPGVTVRDIALSIITRVGDEKGDYRSFEFCGPLLERIGIDGRMTLCTCTPELGGKTGIINPDKIILNYIEAITREPFVPLSSDPDAEYEEVFDFNVSDIVPQIAVPPRPDTAVPVSEKIGIPINQAAIGSCSAGTLSELREAAIVFKEHKVAPHVRCYITPGTQEIFKKALKEGLIEIFADAGAIVTPAGCGVCSIASYGGKLGDGDVCIATVSRNDPGRMGSSKSEIYIASALTVAASAINGKIADPREFI